jgi:hypothetical protein
MDPSDYAREIERYLCRKNDGHLIRIVGPAFEQVCGWAQQGVPLKVAFRGIDQYCERYYAKGPRRRPVRIEFCEADILDLFDAWRRAIGVSAPRGGGAGEPEEPKARKPALAAHVERVVARLVNVLDRGEWSGAFTAALDDLVRELEPMTHAARGARGDARARLIERLGDLDRAMMEAGLRELDPAARARLRAEAGEELAPFGGRLAPDARASALDAAFTRLARESLGLPTVTYE